MYLGIDLGTSSVKVVLVDDEQQIVGQAIEALSLQRPQPLWSEQDPDEWFRATAQALDALHRSHATALSGVRAIGLSGQMHGATLLDASDRVLRPALLWNDGRSEAECRALEAAVPQIRRITGNLVMPGFTAPKVAWVRAHEPEVFARVARVLLPKDYLRLRLSGESVSEMSDASGTLWLEVGARRWSGEVLEATGLDERAMPGLIEGSEPSGVLKRDLASRWGIPTDAMIAGGAGDQAAGAIGAGIVDAGQALLSLGTSGVLFIAGDRFLPDPENAVHAFCHCLPARWHQMSVMLSAAGSLAWVTRLVGAESEAALLASVARKSGGVPPPIFLPYLSGERTPHNDPHAKGVFFGLTLDHDSADLARAVLEGVAFALRDGQSALLAAGATIRDVTVVGGGARSQTWARILAAALERPLCYAAEAEVGPAFGAARLARLAYTREQPEEVCIPPRMSAVVEPDSALVAELADRYARFRVLYRNLAPIFR